MSTSRLETARTPRPVLLTLVIAATVLLVVGGVVTAPELRTTGPGSVADLLIVVLLGAVYVAVGAVILLRAGWNRVGWALVAAGALFPVVSAVGLHLSLELAEFLDSNWLFPILLALIAYVALVFPSGRLPAGRSLWARLARAAAMALAVFMVMAAADAIAVVVFGASADPNDFSWLPQLVGDALWFLFLFAPLVGAVLSMVVRFVRSQGEERAQLSWVMAALLLFVVTLILTNVAIFVFGASEDVYGWALVPILALPVSIAVAITRYRLYDIDRLLSRTATYGVVVGVLAAVYVMAILLLRGLLPFEGPFPVAVSTLGVAALFNPLRRRVQEWVARRFNRGRYDAEQEIKRFALRLRGELDLSALSAELVQVVGQTMQPTTVSLWLAEEGR